MLAGRREKRRPQDVLPFCLRPPSKGFSNRTEACLTTRTQTALVVAAAYALPTPPPPSKEEGVANPAPARTEPRPRIPGPSSRLTMQVIQTATPHLTNHGRPLVEDESGLCDEGGVAPAPAPARRSAASWRRGRWNGDRPVRGLMAIAGRPRIGVCLEGAERFDHFDVRVWRGSRLCVRAQVGIGIGGSEEEGGGGV
jgi:hypothetical protein